MLAATRQIALPYQLTKPCQVTAAALSAGSLKAARAGYVWLQKAHFLQLMQTESLAMLRCQLDGGMVTICGAGTDGFQGNLAIPMTGRDAKIYRQFPATT